MRTICKLWNVFFVEFHILAPTWIVCGRFIYIMDSFVVWKFVMIQLPKHFRYQTGIFSFNEISSSVVSIHHRNSICGTPLNHFTLCHILLDGDSLLGYILSGHWTSFVIVSVISLCLKPGLPCVKRSMSEFPYWTQVMNNYFGIALLITSSASSEACFAHQI